MQQRQLIPLHAIPTYAVHDLRCGTSAVSIACAAMSYLEYVLVPSPLCDRYFRRYDFPLFKRTQVKGTDLVKYLEMQWTSSLAKPLEKISEALSPDSPTLASLVVLLELTSLERDPETGELCVAAEGAPPSEATALFLTAALHQLVVDLMDEADTDADVARALEAIVEALAEPASPDFGTRLRAVAEKRLPGWLCARRALAADAEVARAVEAAEAAEAAETAAREAASVRAARTLAANGKAARRTARAAEEDASLAWLLQNGHVDLGARGPAGAGSRSGARGASDTSSDTALALVLQAMEEEGGDRPAPEAAEALGGLGLRRLVASAEVLDVAPRDKTGFHMGPRYVARLIDAGALGAGRTSIGGSFTGADGTVHTGACLYLAAAEQLGVSPEEVKRRVGRAEEEARRAGRLPAGGEPALALPSTMGDNRALALIAEVFRAAVVVQSDLRPDLVQVYWPWGGLPPTRAVAIHHTGSHYQGHLGMH